jgi:AraC-like DNA-binding protein
MGVKTLSSPEPVQSYRERLPAPEIASHVSSVWALNVAGEGPAYEHRTVPNGSVEISYAIGADVVVVSGPQRRPTTERVAPGTTIVGVRFRPGRAPAILGQPASELVDLRVEADDVFGRRAATLAERLGDAGSTSSVLLLLEEELACRLATAAATDLLVTTALDRLRPGIPSRVGEPTAELPISPRQLRRRFVTAVGYGPKTFQRIIRFQGFLALAQLSPDSHAGLVGLAKRAGYADQAHLTRECAALTRLTPQTFLEEMWKSCGPSHDHEASFAGLRHALLAA